MLRVACGQHVFFVISARMVAVTLVPVTFSVRSANFRLGSPLVTHCAHYGDDEDVGGER